MSESSEDTSAVLTVEDFLRGQTAYPVKDEALAAILVARDVESGTAYADATQKQVDLCKADLFMWCARLPKTTASVEDVNGVWKHKEGSVYISDADRRYLIKLARAIYDKYGETVTSSSIKFNNQGMRWMRR